MQIKTILNRVQKYQSFIYTDFKLTEDKQLKLDITIRPRSNSRPICSGSWMQWLVKGWPVPGSLVHTSDAFPD